MSTEIMDAKVLTQITPFSVMWDSTTTTKKTAKSGGLYEKKVVVVENVSLSHPISVEVTREQYEKLRIMSFKGIKYFTATEGVANDKGWRPLILAGAPAMAESK